MLKGAREHFEAARVTETGYLRPTKKLLVDIFVSKECLTRALDTANQLFLALENQGHSVEFAPTDRAYSRTKLDHRKNASRDLYSSITWAPIRSTVVFVKAVPIGLTLYEPAEEVEVQSEKGGLVRVSDLPPRKVRRTHFPGGWVHKDFMPTGRLSLRAYSPDWRVKWGKEWHEANPGDLLAKIETIGRVLRRETATILRLIEEADRRAEEQHKIWEEQHREWVREEEERRRAEALKESREQLLEIVQAWALARNIEDFFEDAQRRASSITGDEQRNVLERVNRARELLGGTDTLKRFGAWRSPEDRFSPEEE